MALRVWLLVLIWVYPSLGDRGLARGIKPRNPPVFGCSPPTLNPTTRKSYALIPYFFASLRSALESPQPRTIALKATMPMAIA